MIAKLKNEKIYGFPIVIFLIITAVVAVFAVKGLLDGSMIGCLIFAIFWGISVGYIGDRIPVWKQIGGGMLLIVIVTGAMYTFQILPQEFIDSMNNFNNNVGFLNLYILILITGSVMSIDRKLLLQSFGKYIPTLLLSILFSFLVGGLAGLIVNKGFITSVMDFAFPIMGGGNGAGAIPMSTMWSAATGQDSQVWYAPALAILGIANMIAILLASLLNQYGKKKPHLTGNGMIVKNAATDKAEQTGEKKQEVTPKMYVMGLMLALACYVGADIYSSHISFINRAGLGFTIHTFAFMIIIVIILNLLNVVPKEVKEGAIALQKFFGAHMTLPLMVFIGIGTNLYDFVSVFSLANLVIILAVIAGAVLGAFIGSKIFNLYIIDGIIAAALGSASCGGTGNVAVCGAADRMSLLPYAQISSRVGGAIMLVIASVVFGAFL